MASEVYIFGSWQGPRKQDLRLFWSGIHPAPMSPADFLNPILKLSTCKIPRDRRQGQGAAQKTSLSSLVFAGRLSLHSNSAFQPQRLPGGSLPMARDRLDRSKNPTDLFTFEIMSCGMLTVDSGSASIILDAMQPASSHRHFQMSSLPLQQQIFERFVMPTG
ncbi:hypothetical protein ACO22_01782 [Paracoccidioides brasiliensis]|uniref:Uncharacterized protein n=1 Tax=Paracoccidioides brasiliensis TaxID=121759 RepID=A0A1D2JKY8_PARBR|nr:hypothetical protein ACO22_01782 [Paracoccidioides brasiliensis]